MKWLKHNWQTLIFNIVETLIIFLFGLALNLNVSYIIAGNSASFIMDSSPSPIMSTN